MSALLRGLAVVSAVFILTLAVFGSGEPALASTAVVVAADTPDGLLRVRNGPGTQYDIIGWVRLGEVLELTGVRTNSNWAEISAPIAGWVYASQIRPTAYAEVPPAYIYGVPGVVTPYVYRRPYRVWKHRYRAYGSYPVRSFSRSSRYYGHRGGVGVTVGPRGGVGVHVGRFGIGVGPHGSVRVRAR
jgi:uncharacterized protein YraI